MRKIGVKDSLQKNSFVIHLRKEKGKLNVRRLEEELEIEHALNQEQLEKNWNKSIELYTETKIIDVGTSRLKIDIHICTNTQQWLNN